VETKDWLIRDLKENWLEERAEKVEKVNKLIRNIINNMILSRA